jgi:dimethylaniline monooxygenase (N-oxide forming)
MDFSAMDNADASKLIEGKKVAIIGAHKSAVDVAALCANVNGENLQFAYFPIIHPFDY